MEGESRGGVEWEAVRTAVSVEAARREVRAAAAVIAEASDLLPEQAEEILRGFTDITTAFMDRMMTYTNTCVLRLQEAGKLSAVPIPPGTDATAMVDLLASRIQGKVAEEVARKMSAEGKGGRP